MPDHEPRLTGTKVCTHCHEEKPVLAFPVDKAARDGLHPWCRDCTAAFSRKWHANHRKPHFDGWPGTD